jgi:hypothetical protein
MEENKLSPRANPLGEEYYTVDDLSKYFNVSHDLIVHFIKNGTIKTFDKDNQHILIPKKDFNQGARGILEYLLSGPVDNKAINQKINLKYTFWIFGLGMGLGSWFVSGQLSDFIVGIIIGALIWFVVLILFGGLATRIYKWTKGKIGKYGLIDGNADAKARNAKVS